MKFKVTSVYYPVGDKTRYRVVAKNGQWVAECKSQLYADRVAKGLQLEFNESEKLKNFRI